MIRVELPTGLRLLARIEGVVELEVPGVVSQQSVFDALEARFPALRGSIRDARTGRRRALLRIFACRRDLSHEAPETPLPAAVAAGDEPLVIIGAIAGG